MDDLIPEIPVLANIILLTAYFYADQLIGMLNQQKPDIKTAVFEHPKQILSLPPVTLAQSRLISFGSRFYVGDGLLRKFGFGAYNFHPGPSHYPGWAPFNFALYDGATEYGVTVHEMTNTIDAGDIIALRNFSMSGIDTVQRLMDITTHNMYVLFNELAPRLVLNEKPEKLNDAEWSGTLGTKRLFRKMCQLTLEIEKEELDRRMSAFGDGDGAQLPFIIHNNQFYEMATGNEPADHQSLILHGYRFILRRY